MSRRVLCQKLGSGGFDYSGAFLIYSLRKLIPNWTDAIIQIRRSSDNTTAYVFFDGDTITINSFISTSSSTTPSGTTLTTWIGADDGFVIIWHGQTSTGSIDINKIVSNFTNTEQPQIISTGAFITKNGLPSLKFDGSNDYLSNLTPASAINNGNTFTLIFLASDNVGSSAYFLFSNRTGASFDGFQVAMNSNAVGWIARLIHTPVTVETNYISPPITTLDQRLLTTIVSPSSMTSYYNSVLEETLAHSQIWANNVFYVARDRTAGAGYLNGTIQEIILYASDITAELPALNTDINAYYSIY